MMELRWSDIADIVIELEESYPDLDPLQLNFVDLQRMVIGLEGFTDDPERGGEKVLEAIQMGWIEERE